MGEDTKYCGHCKREVSSINFTIHAVHCQRNIAICSMCNEPVPRSHYQQHIETSHKSIPCPKCSLKVEPLKIFTHEKEHCPKRMVTCEHCELELTAADHEKHKEYCEARTERCKGCTKYVQVRYLQFHYETDHKYLKPEDKARADENSDDEGSECPICLGPVTLPLALDCGHVFCMVCVKGIANTTKNCAICRRDITRDMLMDIRFCREEDIIKNYVNKPREKKTVRSHSVPSRGTGPGGRRLVHHTTEDYDEMVSALMSSRSTTPSYRYQRPANTNNLPSYTPYTSTTPSTSDSCKDSCKDSCNDSCKNSSESCKDSFQEDDCCCSSSRSPSSNSQTTTTNSISSSVSSSSTSPVTTTTSTQRNSRDSVSRTVVSPSSYSAPPIRSSSGSRTIASYSSRSITDPSRTSTSSNSTSTSSSKVSTFSTSHDTTTITSSPSASSSNKTSCTSSTAPVSSSTTTSSYSSSYSNGARPRRPTTLALETNAVLTTLAAQTSSSNSRLSGTRSAEPPANATQEQYDRWLAFQLAKADDDLPPSEFNRKHKPAFRRSFSMPERPDNVSDSSSSGDSDSDAPSSRGSSRRPPASPRNTATSSACSSTRSTPISKSSSDSNASSSCGTGSNGSALSTGARPKSSGLRKRVSFKEDAPPIRREAPVLLPCEFCDEMFPERDLMRHQTSCEQNETQLPRSSRLAQLAAANGNPASTANLTSTSSKTNISLTSACSTTVNTQSTSAQIETGPSQPPRRRQGKMATPVCMPPRKATLPNASPTTERKVADSSSVSARKSPAPIPRRTVAQNRNQEAPTTSPPPSCPSSISPPPVSPPPTTTITIVDQPPAVVMSPNLSSGSSRPFSISPASSTSTNNSSVSSGSLSSSSTTPSTSSSASPVPVNMPNPDIAPPDTPTTDIELEYDEDIPFSRPRKGRLLSSAIFSWRSISGSAATRRGGYARSNTAPLEDTNTDDSPQPLQPVTTSKSATQLPSQQSPETESPSSYPIISRSPSPSKRQLKQISSPPQSEIMKEQQVKDISPPLMNASTQDPSETVFVKNPNKYKAPPPPQPPTQGILLPTTQSVSPSHNKKLSNTTPPSNSLPGNINTHEKIPVKSQSITENVIQNFVTKGHSHDQNGCIKFDSKPMMNSFVQKEAELRINCEFCKQVFTPEKFRCHQTVCEAALRPVSRQAATPVDQSPPQKSKSPIPAKHNKGPAPPPPPPPPQTAEPVPPERPAKDSSINKRLERSHSVKDERSSYRVTRRLERASSIKESRTTNSYMNKSSFNRWGSRDCVYSNGIDSPTSYSSTGWSGSTSNIYGGWTGNGSHAWSSHINMVRDDLRHRAAASSVNALSQDNGGDSDNGGENEVDTEGNGRDSRSSRTNSCNSLLVEVRAALNKTSPSHFAVDTGGARYRERSSSRTRPISMYSMSSGGWGSMYDLASPSRTFNISDAFSTASLASKRRYIR
ncbi:uncharacterized protein [Palaemon carinicauda]|uniref:uncharacterized protein isoform X2 n=1 Tax=Palaemon carinicauda TaxID=392227 RepID=UPI0035B5AA5B